MSNSENSQQSIIDGMNSFSYQNKKQESIKGVLNLPPFNVKMLESNITKKKTTTSGNVKNNPQIDTLLNQQNLMSSDLGEMKGGIKEILQKLDKKKQNQNQTKEQYEELNTKYKKLELDSEYAKRKQEKKYGKLQNELISQKKSSDEDKDTIKRLKQDVVNLENLKKQQEETIKELKEEKKFSKQQILSMSQNNNNKSDNLLMYQQRIDELDNQIKELKNKYKQLEEEKNDQIQQLQASNKQQMTQHDCEIAKLKNKIQEEHNNYIRKLDEIVVLKKQIDAKDKDCKVKDESLGNIEHLSKEKTMKIKQLEQDIKNLKEQVQIEQNNIKELNQSMTKLKAQLLSQKGNIDQTQNQALIDEMNQIQNKQEQQRLKKQLDEENQKKQREIDAQQKQQLINEQKQKYEEDKKLKIERFKIIQKKIQESHGQLEVCFLIDCTGSMDPYKEQTMKSITGSMEAIKKETGRDVKWSTVCYQDYEELAALPGKQYQQLNFTKQPEELAQYLQNIKCTGGGDFAEDIRGGIIQMCQKISWDKPFRLAILICDAPSHGVNTNGGCGDNYPNDDIRDAILMLIKQDIMFVGLNFTKYTKTMYSYIEKIFLENKRQDLYTFFDMQNLNQDIIWEQMIKKILSATVVITQTNKKDTKSIGDKPTDVPKTKDGAIEALCKAGNFYDFEKQADVKCLDTKFKVFRVDIKEDSFNSKLEDIHEIKVPEDYEVYNEGNWDCIRTVKPFAFGMMKEVYLMKKKNATQELYVIKTPLGGKTYKTLNDAITECRSHLVCQKLMKKFVKEVNDAVNEAEAKGLQVKRYPQIVYSDFLILEEGPNSFWIAERFFNGEFIKYNNNFGYINNEETQLNQMAQVFSYYTYHVSNFSYMVNDVQGVSTYFTDPAINTSKGKFDDTDMGSDGTAMFMVNFAAKKQFCSEILKLLKINPD